MRKEKMYMIAFFLCLSTLLRGQGNFEDRMGEIIEKIIRSNLKTIGETENSEIVFFEYDFYKKKLSIEGDKKSNYTTFAEKIITDTKLSQFINDSAKGSFLLPLYFMVIHDRTGQSDSDLTVSMGAIANCIDIIKYVGKGGKKVFEPRIIMRNAPHAKRMD